MMANGDPRDRFFYPTRTLMIDSYTVPFQEDILSETKNDVDEDFGRSDHTGEVKGRT